MLWQWIKSLFGKAKAPAAPVGDHMKLGEWGEQVAAEYLRKQGHEILERRFRVPYLKGEIDLITRDSRDHNCIVFVEVKTRRSKDFIPAEAAVHSGKRLAITRTARAYLRRRRYPARRRYDVISVYPNADPGGEPVVEHFPNSFQERPPRRYRSRRPRY
jgi:putative endonuclease